MPIWQTATGASNTFYVLDPVSQQAYFATMLQEGPNKAVLHGRVKAANRVLTEIELYTSRSRGDVGFIWDADGLAKLPIEWTQQISRERRPTRSQLLQAGRSVFDLNVPSPESASACMLMENGTFVSEDPEVLKAIVPSFSLNGVKLNPDGTVPAPCGAPPDRPADPEARTSIVDDEQGIVVSMGTVQGVVQPYIITRPTISAYVPDAMLQPYTNMLKQQVASGKYKLPRVRAMPASIAVTMVYRIYDGKIQGMHMFQKLGAPGGRSPWIIAASGH